MDILLRFSALTADATSYLYAVTGTYSIFWKRPMKTPIFILSALSFSALAAQPTPVNGQITDAVTQTNTSLQSEESAKLDTVNVTADFRQLDLMQIPSSITVVSEDDIKNRNADHLESILSLAPNVNFAAGASRARFFQIRGIGERSQFIDPVNPSVGLIIDGIDMTGLGGAATLFDIDQVEILRGPQGTAFGANALAGAINIKSKQPTKETEGYVQGKLGNYNTQGLGAAVSGSLANNVQARFAINQVTSDGYMENEFLNKKDTNGFDEKTLKAQLLYTTKNNDLHLTSFITKAENGYDAFTIDNTRTTQSDQPGKDDQTSKAFSLTTKHNGFEKFSIESTSQFSTSDTFYSYDYDWMHLGFRGNTISDYEEFERTTKKGSIDLRILSNPESDIFNESTSWVFGAYNQASDEDLGQKRIGDYGNSDFNYNLTRNSQAIYTELNTFLTHTTSLIYGLRVENFNSDFETSSSYSDTQNELLYAGKISLEHLVNNQHLSYVSFSRGYKTGGFNTDPNNALPADLIQYDTEYNWATEIGLKSNSLNEDFNSRIALFHIYRDNQQVKSSTVRDNGATFIDSFTNAADGYSYGIEIETSWNISPGISWSTSIGLLETEINDFSINIDTDGDWENDTVLDKSGRNQAHAPSYSLATQLHIKLTNSISSSVELEAKDDFYFSDSHDAKSNKYELLHASTTYKKANFSATLAIKNITNEDTETRGFSGWVQDPQGTIQPGKYVQFGEPRLISLSARYDF